MSEFGKFHLAIWSHCGYYTFLIKKDCGNVSLIHPPQEFAQEVRKLDDVHC